MRLEQGIKTQDLPGIPKVGQGKVRELFEVDGHLLMVATDRISAFDVILPNAIPHKGKVLTQLSAFWFERLEGMVAHHLVSVRVDEFPAPLQPFREELAGRSMLVRKCTPLPIECVVRGYLAGSGWAEYRQSETVCGNRLPSGLVESAELPEPIFTPATKATNGHDENISFDRAAQIIGPELAEQVRDLSLRIYNRALSAAEIQALYNEGGWPTLDTIPPSAPADLAATPRDQQITLTWSPNSEADLSHYVVYQGTAAGFDTAGTAVARVNAPDTTATVSGLTNGVTYYFVVAAVDSSGNQSAASNEKYAIPIALPTAGLVAYYPFNGNANDESGNGNDGTVNGATLAADRFGSANSAYSFDGVDDYIDLSLDGTSFSSTITLAAWVFRTSSKRQWIISNDWSSSRGNNMNTAPDDHVSFQVSVPGQAAVGTGSTTPLPVSVWTFVAMTYDGASVRGYIDGAIDNSANVSGSLSGTGSYRISHHPYVALGQRHWGGLIDDIRIYNRALSTAEIQALYLEGQGDTPPAAPTNLTARIRIGDEQVTLTWSPNSEADFLRYRIYSGTSTGPTTKVDSTTGGINDTTKAIAGLRNGITYYYRITAVDSAGNESEFSAEESTTRGPLITDLPTSYSATVNNPITIRATVTSDFNETAVENVYLSYTKGNQATFIQASMTDLGSDHHYSGTIPRGWVTTAGVAYFIMAEDRFGSSYSDTLSIPVQYSAGAISTNMANSAFRDGFPYDKWRLISLPGDLDNKTVLGTIRDELGGAPSDSTWMLYQYVGPGSNDYQEATSFALGASYFLKQVGSEQAVQFRLGSGKSYDLTGFSITLQPGKWRFVSAPYPFPVDVDANQSIF
ncbi:MAG: phosphoribosylaminoimidazolesuccinocarboxamide synthase, partial [Candidatus Marinimicrobia bacterium]|nr:phosphoribosylaminoimidazolesuccinocarboxamide synthase [Candidatus Neomarinimicrobiota bacterium]